MPCPDGEYLASALHFPDNRAFTLLELLTGMAILGVMVVLLFQAFRASSDVAVRNQGKIEMNQASRAVLDQIARDLERVGFQKDTVTIFTESSGELISGVVPTNTLHILPHLPAPENPYGSVVNVGYRIAAMNVGGVDKWVMQRGDDAAVDPGVCSNNWWNFSACPFNANTDPEYDGYNPEFWKMLSENIISVRFDFYTNVVAAGGGSDQSTRTWNSITIPTVLPYSVKVTTFCVDSDTYNKAMRIDPTLTGAGTNLIIANVRSNSVRVFLPCSTANQ